MRGVCIATCEQTVRIVVISICRRRLLPDGFTTCRQRSLEPVGRNRWNPLSGVPQRTVLGPLLFLIMISDIDKDVSASKLVSFADDTRLYSGVGDATDCDNLQLDLNDVYDWASSNNMFFNSQKFIYVCFSSNVSAYKSNLYIDPAMNIIGPSTHVRDLGVSMSSNCKFDFHIFNPYKRCSNLAAAEACWLDSQNIYYKRSLSNAHPV